MTVKENQNVAEIPSQCSSPILLSDKVVFQGVTQNEMAGHTAFTNVFKFIQSFVPDFGYEIEESTVAPSLRALFV